MWEFIKKHPILFGALLFFFLAAIGLGVGLTLTGVFAPFGLTLLGLAGAGALLFAVTFIPPALILGVMLRRAWVFESLPELPVGVPKETDNLTKNLDEPEVGDSVTPAPEGSLTSKTSTTSSISSGSFASTPKPSVSPQEQTEKVQAHIQKTAKEKGWVAPSASGWDPQKLMYSIQPDGSLRVTYKDPNPKLYSPEVSDSSFYNRQQGNYKRKELMEFFDSEYGTSRAGLQSCPPQVIALVGFIDQEWGKETTVRPVPEVVDGQEPRTYFYQHYFEIPAEKVAEIFLSIPKEEASPVAASSSASTASTVPTSGSMTTVLPSSAAGSALGFSPSPLAAPKGSAVAITPPAPLTKEQLEEVKAEVLKVGISNSDVIKLWLGDNPQTKFEVSSSGEMSLRIVNSVIYTFDSDPIGNRIEAKFETQEQSEKRTIPRQLSFIDNLNKKYENAAEISTVMESRDYDAHNYSYGFKISADKVRVIWESLKLEKEAAATQTPTSASTPPPGM